MWDVWTQARVLRGAADHVIGAGLLKGSYTEEGTMKRCTVSALRHVALRQGRLNSAVEHEASDMMGLMILVAEKVNPRRYQELRSQGSDFPELIAITEWNDAPERTVDDVSEALRTIADSLVGG